MESSWRWMSRRMGCRFINCMPAVRLPTVGNIEIDGSCVCDVHELLPFHVVRAFSSFLFCSSLFCVLSDTQHHSRRLFKCPCCRAGCLKLTADCNDRQSHVQNYPVDKTIDAITLCHREHSPKLNNFSKMFFKKIRMNQ